VSWIYLIGVLEITDLCDRDISLVSRRYLIGFLEIFNWSWRYLVSVLEIFNWCLGDIW